MLMDVCAPGIQNYVLANGPRKSTKTFGCHNVTAQHAWNTDRGNICLLTFTQSVGIDSGVWQHLTEIFLPDWISGNFGMKWVREPYVQNVTKKPACEVTNRFGNKTRITLESLRNEDEVEERFKGKVYSMIWVNELSKFSKRKTFDTLIQCFRMPQLRKEDHLFLADTNPDLVLAKSSPWHHLWYEFPHMSEEQLLEAYPHVDPKRLKPLQRRLRLIEFDVDDNLSMSQADKDDLYAELAFNEDLIQAYYFGKWGSSGVDALFYKVFREKFHVVGETEMPGNPTPEVMQPEENCIELYTGNDPGVTNCASVIFEKFFPDPLIYPQYKDKPAFKLLDELVITGADFSLEAFIETLVKKMRKWEELAGKPGKILWTHWSDRSVFDMKVPFTDKMWHEEIMRVSGGLIRMQAADRGKGSVNARIDLFRKLLYDERIFINKNYCPVTIEMCKSIKGGKTQAGGIAKGSVHKHPFDATTYGLASECAHETQKSNLLNLQNKLQEKGKTESGLVTVRW